MVLVNTSCDVPTALSANVTDVSVVYKHARKATYIHVAICTTNDVQASFASGIKFFLRFRLS